MEITIMKNKDNLPETIEWYRSTTKKLVETIEQTIHEKINELKSNFREPYCIILNEKAYIALCYVLKKYHLIGCSGIDLEYYREIMVILDVNASDDVKVLQKPFDEFLYPLNK